MKLMFLISLYLCHTEDVAQKSVVCINPTFIALYMQSNLLLKPLNRPIKSATLEAT